ncbi:hypothetical protein D3C86_1945740 [compost metagenome]
MFYRRECPVIIVDRGTARFEILILAIDEDQRRFTLNHVFQMLVVTCVVGLL